MTRHLLISLLGLLGLGFLAIQAVPYRVHNPPVVQEPAWDRPATEALARRACYDCHSNEADPPWYGAIAPMAWLVRYHVDEARAQLNFSEMQRPQHEAHEAGEEVAEGEMPPAWYLVLHPEARLTEAERRALARGLDATLGGEEEGEADQAEPEGRRSRRGRGRRSGFGEHDEEEDDD